MNKRLQVFKYLFFDLLSAATSWTLFFVFRKLFIESEKFGFRVPINLDSKYLLGILIIPIFWIIFYAITGFYRNVYRKSRLMDLGHTLVVSVLGVVIIFLILLLDDTVITHTDYYSSLIVLFTLHFVLTSIPRLILTTQSVRRIHNGKIGFKTLIIGGNGEAVRLFKEMKARKKSAGNLFVGYVNINENSDDLASQYLENLGTLNDIDDIIDRYEIEEVIIAIESSEYETIGRIINRLSLTRARVKAIPSMYDLLTGRVKVSSIYGTPLLEINHDLIPFWQQSFKVIIDVIFSILALVILLPIIIILIVGIKLSSRGPILYSHERVGKYGKPFILYKFRSMIVEAEKHGPELSSRSDSRIFPFGRFMRKHRLDEIPNFINVLKGEMSLVGPRPERKYYINKIIEKAPEYSHLHKVRPGITSWGQVKYGYAENVEQMIERMKYDLIYIENMTPYVDFKILIYTLLTIFKGKGI